VITGQLATGLLAPGQKKDSEMLASRQWPVDQQARRRASARRRATIRAPNFSLAASMELNQLRRLLDDLAERSEASRRFL
jgi:hypothetical protein